MNIKLKKILFGDKRYVFNSYTLIFYINIISTYLMFQYRRGNLPFYKHNKYQNQKQNETLQKTHLYIINRNMLWCSGVLQGSSGGQNI